MLRVLTLILVATIVMVCLVIGSTGAWSNLASPQATGAYVTTADFDRAFAEAAKGRRDFTPAVREKLRDGGWNSINAAAREDTRPGSDMVVNRERKGARLPVFDRASAPSPLPTVVTTIVRPEPEPAAPAAANNAGRRVLREIDKSPAPSQRPSMLDGCEPVASPFADPVLGKVIGRCIL